MQTRSKTKIQNQPSILTTENLIKAVYDADREMIKFLIENKVDPREKIMYNGRKINAFNAALQMCTRNDLPITPILLEYFEVVKQD